MEPKSERIALGSLVAAGLLLASCRGCLETDVSFDEGSGGGSSSPASGSTTGAVGSTTGTSETTSAVSSTQASSGASTTASSSASTGSGAGACAYEDFSELPDECWEQLDEPEYLRNPLMVEGGTLVVEPDIETGWWDPPGPVGDSRGWFMYQPVAGDFVISVDVSVEADEEDLYQMAGILLRDPRGAANNEEWIKWELGYRETAFASLSGANLAGANVDAFHIDGGTPNVEGVTSARLGVCRVGDEVTLAIRPEGSEFQFAAGVTLGDAVPGFADVDVQVGIIANAYFGEASLVARFAELRLDSASPSDCVGYLEAQATP